jgi:arsenate reductase
MAEAFFNHIAEGKAKAYSAGTQPADRVNPVVVEAMREIGIDIGGNKPKRLTDDMLEQADIVVTMGCGAEGACPATFVKTEEWELADPEAKPLPEVRRIRDEPKARVVELLRKMQRENRPQTREQTQLSSSWHWSHGGWSRYLLWRNA